eukprot:Platyproteum_vivax@DN32_c0_g1_i1.p2
MAFSKSDSARKAEVYEDKERVVSNYSGRKKMEQWYSWHDARAEAEAAKFQLEQFTEVAQMWKDMYECLVDHVASNSLDKSSQQGDTETAVQCSPMRRESEASARCA